MDMASSEPKEGFRHGWIQQLIISISQLCLALFSGCFQVAARWPLAISGQHCSHSLLSQRKRVLLSNSGESPGKLGLGQSLCPAGGDILISRPQSHSPRGRGRKGLFLPPRRTGHDFLGPEGESFSKRGMLGRQTVRPS